MTTGFVRSRLRAGVGIGCAAVLALSGAVLTTPAAAALPQSIEQADPDGELAIVPDTLVSITPARFVDTRSGAATVDGQFAGGGKRAADTEFEITVAGRDTVPADAAAVVVNVTAVDPDDRGYVTLHPCVGPRPLASSLNFVGDVNTGNEVVAALSSDGSICAYTSSSTHLTIDVVGYVPATGEISPIVPARLLDTRPAATTVDGVGSGAGRTTPGSSLTVPVAGRGGVPASGVHSVLVNVTAVNAQDRGFVVAHGCLPTVPSTSSLNHVAGVNRGNELLVELSADGEICLFTNRSIHLTVDVVSYILSGSTVATIAPSRLADSRPGGVTVDGADAGFGTRSGGSEYTLQVTGRAGVPTDAQAAVVNLTAVAPTARGFITVHPCVSPRPVASSLNYIAGVNGANELIAGLSADGELCIFTNMTTDFAVDIVGYLADSAAPMADLSITKSDNVDPVIAGNPLTYTVTVSNAGPADAENVRVTDELPDDMTFVSTTGCDNDPAGAPECQLGDIAAGTSKQFTITSAIPIDTASATVTNSATVGSDTADPVGGNNTAQEDTTIQGVGTISIVKASDPTGGTGFGFTDDIAAPNAFTLDDGQTQTFIDLTPGTYTVVEDDPTPSFDLGALTCDDGASATPSTTDLGARTATINLDPGESITCTFGNVERGSVTIVEDTDPDGPTDFAFTDDIALPNSFSLDDDTDPTLANTQTFTMVGPGTYDVTQIADPDFAVAVTCDDSASATPSTTGGTSATVNVDPGEDVTCTFTNTRKTGTIEVVKDFVGTAGLVNLGIDMIPQVTNVGDGGTTGAVTVDTGDHFASEAAGTGTDLDDYTTTHTCTEDTNTASPIDGAGTSTDSIPVEEGDAWTCTFTNTERGTIIVEKQTLPDGDPQTFTFTGDAAGIISDNGTITVNDLTPGTYTSTETAVAGWNLTDISCDDANSTGNTTTATATFNLEPGETVTCTYTNTERGTIIVEKQTLPDGDPQTFTFTGDAAGIISDNGTITVNDLTPGTYTTTETAVAGWNLTDISCDDANSTGNTTTATATFNLEPGETVTCTYTNTERGTIIVEKQTLPDGDPQTFTFTGDAAGTISDNGTITVNDLTPGTYTTTETTVAGWNLTDISCDDANSTGNTTTATATFNLEPGETVTCTYTSSFNSAPTITSGDTQSAAENQTAVTTVTATDPDLPAQTLTFSITGGADQALFGITAGGVLTFNTAPDFEALADANNDNDYEVEVTVTDSGGLSDSQAITVTLTDVNDPPEVTTSAGTTAFTEAGGAVVGDNAVTVTDQDNGSLASATVAITNVLDGTDEVLAATTAGTSITASYVAGTLTLTGADTIANYQTVLQSVTYDNASLDPDETDRTIRFVVNDGTVDSNDADKTVSVTAVNSPPTAVDDAYSVPVNVVLDAGGSSAGATQVEDMDGVLTKGTDDSDPETNPLTVTGIVGCADTTAPFTDCPTTGGGTVTINADGTFTYLSQTGEDAATDTFEYTLSDGLLTDTGTVTVTLGDTIWFIDAAASAGGNGTSAAPFNTVTSFDTQANDGAGDIIFVAGGTYTDAGFRLLANQQLIGATIGLTSGNLTIAPSGGTAPTISSSTGQIVIFLGANNTVRGFTSAGSLGAGTIIGSNVGTPTIDNFTINGPGQVLGLTNGDLSNIALGSMTTSSSNGDGMRLDNVTGTFNVTAPVAISGPGIAGIDIRNSSATINFSSTADITNSTGTGVLLSNNSGATITFADLDVDNSTSNQPGIVASGGGTLNITTGTVNAGSATAVDIDGLALGVTLRRIDSVGGATPGIDLANTTGSFTVSGSGSGCQSNAGSCNGGAITDKAGNADGVTLSNVTNITFNDMNISNNAGNGIRGSSVSGLTLFDDLRIDGNADQVNPDEAGLHLTQLTGTATISNTTISNSHEHNAIVRNTSGTLTNLAVTGSTFGPNPTGTGADGLLFDHTGGNHTLSVTNSTFDDNKSFGVQATTSGATIDVTVSGSSFTSSSQANDQGQNVGVGISASAGFASFDIVNNPTFSDHRSTAINVFNTGSSSMTGTISGNTVGVVGDLSSGSRLGHGIRVANEGSGTITTLIDNNNVNEIEATNGIQIFSGVNSNTLNATITNNTIVFDSSNGNFLFPISASVTGGGTLCSNISGNTITSLLGSQVRQTSGAHNVVQASEIALQAANAGHDFDVIGTINFNGPVCATPPP